MSRSLRLGNEFLPFASVETIGHRNQNFGGTKPMRKTKMMIAVFVVGTLWVGGALAQDTNAPLTKIEIFEARTGTVIVRGSVLIGTMSAQTGTPLCAGGQPRGRGRAAAGAEATAAGAQRGGGHFQVPRPPCPRRRSVRPHLGPTGQRTP